MTLEELFETLKQSGVAPASVVRLDQEPTSRHVRYIDLLHKNDGELFPDAVVESGGQPFAYVIRRDRLGDEPTNTTSSFAHLIRALACRADARYLCVVSVSTLDVYPIGLFEAVPTPLTSGEALSWKTLLSAAIPFDDRKKRSKDAWLETLLFSLLVDAAKGTQKAAKTLSIQQVLALIGRALFFRFLVDREIVSEDDLRNISSHAENLNALFNTPAALIDTCRWLDATFNGDLLSLEHKDYRRLVEQIGTGIDSVCWHLSNIQYRALQGQLPLDWGGIKFKHVPVDVLSQVYEDFAHEFVPDLAEATSVHFTPRQIAEIVVDGAFSASRRADLHNATVLDPAAGGGVFLVLSFRRLVVENWKKHGKRPTRQQIRKILNTQLTGFDINCDALNIAALSLYLAALELDPSPSPLNDLKFDKLIGSVLHPVSLTDMHTLQRGCADAALGSLSNDVLSYREGTFDIVVANPPWTGFKGSQAALLNEKFSLLMSTKSGTLSSDATKARYGSPDIAFLLAATRWAKPKGAIGFVLHARFLFQDATFILRKHVFSRMRVTGIMNFTALRQDKKLWPTNSAPFFLLVGRNERAHEEDSFYYVSPRHEPHLAKLGQFRVDPISAVPVPVSSVRSSHVFKSIFKGGMLGFRLIKHIESKGICTLGYKLEGLQIKLNAGYQTGKENHAKSDASHLQAYPMATVDMAFTVPANAPKFVLEKLQWARHPNIYLGPLLLFRESPKLERQLRGALYSEGPVAFSESFSGLSFRENEEMQDLMDFLYVLSYSDLFLYFQLLTSSKFGVERDAALQKDMEQFPLIEIENISQEDRDKIRTLAKKLRQGQPVWQHVDQIIADVYDLTSADIQLVEDTLTNELPFVDVKIQASAPATHQQANDFIAAFNNLMEPFGDEQHCTKAHLLPNKDIAGWRFLWIGDAKSTAAQRSSFNISDLSPLTVISTSYWSTQLIVHLSEGAKIVGRIDQSRYWNRTHARLLALECVQSATAVTN